MYNAIYRTYNSPRTIKFIEAFKDGHRPFNAKEQNAIKLYYNRYKETIDTTDVFLGHPLLP
jgi:hypothetical protein